MIKIQHKSLGVAYELPELTQRMVEDYFKALRERTVEPEEISAPEFAGDVVRTAADLEWLNGVNEVGDLKPSITIWLSGKINDHVAEALAVPPE